MARQGVPHNVHIDEKKIQMAVQEAVEDGLAEIITHHQDPRVRAGASKLTLNIAISVDDKGEQFNFEVAAESKRAPRRSFKGTFYGAINKDGQAELIEFDPQQPPLQF